METKEQLTERYRKVVQSALCCGTGMMGCIRCDYNAYFGDKKCTKKLLEDAAYLLDRLKEIDKGGKSNGRKN